MAPSPDGSPSASRSRLIREMSQSLRESRSSPLPHPSSFAHQDDTNTLPSAELDLNTDSTFDPALDNAPESTNHRGLDDDSQPVTNMRSSAARFKYWQPPKPDQRIDTSQVQQEFHDFSDSNELEDSRSIEIGRGQPRSNKNNPNKFLGDMSFSIANDSLYNLSENARPKPRSTPRKSDGLDRANLRRDAQLRRASSLPQKDLENISARLGKNGERVSPRKNATRPNLARLAAEDDESFMERPPTGTFTAKNPRFGNHARQASGIVNDTPIQTPQKSLYATPRAAAHNTGTGTHQSFMLPDLPNLTELVSGSYKDGTPVFSRNAKSRSRFAAAPIPSRLREETTEKHTPIESVPIPSEEKALYTSLQLLRDKLAQMEQDKAESEKKFEEYEAQVAGLRAELTARDEMRRSDSALGSTDGEGNKKDSWRSEKTRLQSQVDSLRNRLERAERKHSVNDIAKKRVTEERDNAVTQLGVAFFNSEEIKTERDELLAENEGLREEVDALRAENDELRDHLSHYEEQTNRLQTNSGRKDSAIRKENETLHTELKKAQAVQAEHAKLKKESDALKAQVAQIKAQRQEEVKQRNNREAELRTKLNKRDETIQSLKGLGGEEANDILRDEIEEMRVLLAELENQREDDAQEWARKETHLRKKVEKSREAAKEARDITKELLNVRRTSSQRRSSHEEPTENPTRTADSRQRQTYGNRKVQESSLPRSSSRTRPGAVRPERRSVSNPQPTAHEDADSEAESTTDLDAFTHSRDTRTATRSMHGAVPDLLNKAQETTGDTTELSFMGRDEIARLRKRLEEERVAARRESRSASRTRSAQDNAVPRKSSMKDLTSASRPMDLTEANTGRILTANLPEPDATAKDATQQSARSQSNSRRRRSAPTDMTSAFIIPDIVNARLAEQHDDVNCTLCRKASCSGEHTAPVEIPEPVPVSERMPDDIDATMRPSQPAPLALATVIKELQDELTHLNLQKAAYDSLLHSHDPSLSRRKRKTVEAKISDLLQAISAKSDQIYALYDVVEGQKDAGQLNEGGEKEVEETLLSVGIDPEEMREKTQKSKGKRVVIDEREKDSEIGGLTDDEELPWEGISETESIPDLNASAGWKRKAVY
ncbi:cep57 centrosome microtubule-binding domain [Diplodia corticola]|uniref:Cep57 centrosome microtubule-binding domain n=1 Tax=Diplodia corticola TaxID=236234 RepID=A0A1J9R964_9PEZI|nr:cep57 centrosome microtubule-binding domain [Diplodia corticola]OJD36730.1 cep57 centrosome microtubule-binding domain [Diplodia corticola]